MGGEGGEGRTQPHAGLNGASNGSLEQRHALVVALATGLMPQLPSGPTEQAPGGGGETSPITAGALQSRHRPACRRGWAPDTLERGLCPQRPHGSPAARAPACHGRPGGAAAGGRAGGGSFGGGGRPLAGALRLLRVAPAACTSVPRAAGTTVRRLRKPCPSSLFVVLYCSSPALKSAGDVLCNILNHKRLSAEADGSWESPSGSCSPVRLACASASSCAPPWGWHARQMSKSAQMT